MVFFKVYFTKILHRLSANPLYISGLVGRSGSEAMKQILNFRLKVSAKSRLSGFDHCTGSSVRAAGDALIAIIHYKRMGQVQKY